MAVLHAAHRTLLPVLPLPHIPWVIWLSLSVCACGRLFSIMPKLLLGFLLAFVPAATQAFSPPSAGLARDLARGKLSLRSASRRPSALSGMLVMQAQAEPPKGSG